MMFLSAASASATAVEFGVSSGPLVRVGVRDLEVGGGMAGFGVSNRAVDLSFERGIDFSVLGTVNARLSAALAFSGGGRLNLTTSGTAGPFALTGSLNVWSAPQAIFDPLAPLAFEPTSLRPDGWSLDLAGRYRVQRDLLVLVSGNLGEQANVGVAGEWRREDLSWRAGARFGDDVLGLTAGLTVRGEGATLALDGLLGTADLGVTASVTVPDPFEVPSSLRAYVAYEPWRRTVEPLRFGVALTSEVGPGELTAELRGGAGRLGARVGYVLPLGAAEDEE